MAVRSTIVADSEVLHTHEAGSNLRLDLTSHRWDLPDGTASVMFGRDVIRPGLRSDGGRNPTGVSLAIGDWPLVDAWGLEFVGRAGVRFRDQYTEYGYVYTAGAVNATFKKLNAPTEWPSEMLNRYIVLREDQRGQFGAREERLITSITTTTNTNDTLNFARFDLDPFPGRAKFHIIYSKKYDKRGIWVTNGRKFWLLHGGSYAQKLDLGSGLEGQRWDMARISSWLVMFVNPKYPPRIVALDSEGEITSLSTPSSLAGMIAPIKPRTEEIPGRKATEDNSWGMREEAITGSMDAGDIRVKVRAVNLDQGGESEFVQVYDEGTRTQDYTTVAANRRLGVFTSHYATGLTAPPFSERWTHIEIWRTTSGGIDYFLDHRVEIARADNEDSTGHSVIEADSLVSDYGTYANITLDDTDLTALPILTVDEAVAGGLPPMCRRVASLQGTTICMGEADEDAVDPTVYSRSWFDATASYNLSASTWTVSDSLFANYEVKAGDVLVITDGGASGPTPGEYAVLSKTNSNVITIANAGANSGASDARGYIKRSHTIEWPKITSDEHVHYSRTSKFAPESFPSRILRLSQIGDTFMDMVNVGKYVAVIMRQGVHLLYKDLTVLRSDAVADFDQGTPWRRSVVSIGSKVVWATAQGPVVMSVSNVPNELGHRGTFTRLGGNTMRQWFRDAYDSGHDIDAGVDMLNECIRWRRTDPNDSDYFKVCQYSYGTERWTLLEDDSGIAYCATTFAEGTAVGGMPLYSVTKEGAVFLVNHHGNACQYDDSTVQSPTFAAGFTVTTTTIAKTGVFSTIMLGDIVRFWSTDSDVDGVARVITAATANQITFDVVADLKTGSPPASGDTFIIGANRFRMRLAPFAGRSKTSVKTIDGITIHARPGPRHKEGAWPDPVAAVIEVRTFADYVDEEHSQVSDVALNMKIYDDDDVSKTSEDRVSGVEGQGKAVELELECIESRADFIIEQIEVRVREEGDMVGDDSATA